MSNIFEWTVGLSCIALSAFVLAIGRPLTALFIMPFAVIFIFAAISDKITSPSILGEALSGWLWD